MEDSRNRDEASLERSSIKTRIETPLAIKTPRGEIVFRKEFH